MLNVFSGLCLWREYKMDHRKYIYIFFFFFLHRAILTFIHYHRNNSISSSWGPEYSPTICTLIASIYHRNLISRLN